MLFGHQNDAADTAAAPDNTTNTALAGDTSSALPAQNPLAVDPDTGVSLPVAPDSLEHEHTDESHDGTTPAFSAPQVVNPAGSDDTDNTASVSSAPAPTEQPNEPHEDLLQPSDNDDLLNLKQQALQQLSPLVDHLDQTPEEKFRTTMMMIQSSDNQALIQTAYDAAQGITDDKARAQALLDIVNEINYFTHAGQETDK